MEGRRGKVGWVSSWLRKVEVWRHGSGVYLSLFFFSVFPFFLFFYFHPMDLPIGSEEDSGDLGDSDFLFLPLSFSLKRYEMSEQRGGSR
jgi:hypothetical protein